MEEQEDELSRIRTILKENPKGLTIDEIAKKFPLNRTSTAKYLNTLQISGQAEMRAFGRAKVFTLSQRVPFSQMLNLSSDLLIVLDQDLIINQVNEPFIRTFNLSCAALIGNPINHPSILQYFSPNDLLLMKESVKGVENCKMERILIDDREYFFKIKMIPVVFDQGSQGLSIILEDITELKKYQQHLEQLVDERTKKLIDTNEKLLIEIEQRQKSSIALEESEKKYRQLVENANSIILRINDQGIILFFNEFAEYFFGIPASEMLGKNILGTIIPLLKGSETKSTELINTFLNPADTTVLNEIECLRMNGEKAWIGWTNKEVIDTGSQVKDFLVVGMDITGRKQAENALHRVNSKLNMVSSITRHDILNKLTVIYGILSLLKEGIVDATQLDYLKQAENAAIAIKRQIVFTRDYKDMGIQKADWLSVADTVRQSIANRDLKSISMEINLKNLEIFADPWLNKVFFNLIDNTLRYSGHATIISVSYHEFDDGLVILYKDNGVGIPIKDKEKIFETSYGRNNGYGLFIAKEILAITGLTIHETGDPDNGVRFEIRVPKGLYRYKKQDPFS